MHDLTTSAAFLLDAIRATGGPVSTADAERILATGGRSCHRNTARKKLRTLARAGHLTAADIDGRRLYHPTTGEDGRP